MTIDGNDKGLGVSHNKMEDNVKANGIDMRRMSQKEIDREIVEMKEQLGIMMMLLRESETDRRYGWRMKNQVAWPIKELFARNIQRRS